jgi:uncharacterized LabA/DUF88 family protein
MTRERAVLFIDGSNWYHSLQTAGVSDLGQLDYSTISGKLVGPRVWVGTRYYIGQVRQVGNRRLYASQRSFLARLRATDARISTHLGRLESRTTQSRAALELLEYLFSLEVRIDRHVFKDLVALATRHKSAEVIVEKAVDVMLAVDMAMMAARDELDAAYLLSADGDFTPAVQAVQSLGKKVYVASPSHGAHVAAAANSFIHLDAAWFSDCYGAGSRRT